MSVESCCKTLRSILESYHVHHIIKYDAILEQMQKYLNKHASNYIIEGSENIHDTEDVTSLGDDFYINPVNVIMNFYDEKQYIPTEEICQIIRWYLEKYQPSCILKDTGKLRLSSYYGEFKN